MDVSVVSRIYRGDYTNFFSYMIWDKIEKNKENICCEDVIMKVIFTVLLIIAVLFALIFSLDLLLGYRYQNAFLKTLDPFRKMEKEEFITLALFFIVYIIKQVIRLYKKKAKNKKNQKSSQKK
jgi:uncharacterized membrane protein